MESWLRRHIEGLLSTLDHLTTLLSPGHHQSKLRVRLAKCLWRRGSIWHDCSCNQVLLALVDEQQVCQWKHFENMAISSCVSVGGIGLRVERDCHASLATTAHEIREARLHHAREIEVASHVQVITALQLRTRTVIQVLWTHSPRGAVAGHKAAITGSRQHKTDGAGYLQDLHELCGEALAFHVSQQHLSKCILTHRSEKLHRDTQLVKLSCLVQSRATWQCLDVVCLCVAIPLRQTMYLR
mmetsp:Transcript_10675/g.29649  ORF Transcript_10675/g.29649 Transcript_10675/m.29649 type:complete len:241 (-) Transcript_10675:239-961(-)